MQPRSSEREREKKRGMSVETRSRASMRESQEKEREEPVMEIARDLSPAALVREKAKAREIPLILSLIFAFNPLLSLFLSPVAGLMSVPLSLAGAG